MQPLFGKGHPLHALEWRLASHPCGCRVWYSDVSHQRASHLVNAFGHRPSWAAVAVGARRLPIPLPRPGWETELVRLGGRTRLWVVNRGGRYSVETR